MCFQVFLTVTTTLTRADLVMMCQAIVNNIRESLHQEDLVTMFVNRLAVWLCTQFVKHTRFCKEGATLLVTRTSIERQDVVL